MGNCIDLKIDIYWSFFSRAQLDGAARKKVTGRENSDCCVSCDASYAEQMNEARIREVFLLKVSRLPLLPMTLWIWVTDFRVMTNEG